VVEDVRLACPCCGYLTLPSRSDYEICPVCFWEDDGQGDAAANEVYGGPNGSLSLTQARANFAAHGACEERFRENVRAPLPAERPALF
jgi:Cysteine-rich CPCC